MERQPCVSILASGRHGTIYIGSDPMKRIHEHRTGAFKGFSSRYEVKRLAHFEMFEDMGPPSPARNN